jgi:hypothetical protein
MSEVTLRYREVIVKRPFYGRFPEYQVVLGRKILWRADTRAQAERWVTENGHTVSSPDRRGDP